MLGVLLVLAWSLPSAFPQDPPHRSYTVADGLNSNTVYCAAQDALGYMWFGTDAGACRFDGVRFERFTASDGLADNEVIGIYADPGGRVWFAGLNGKVSFFSEDRFFNATNAPELQGVHAEGGIMSLCGDGRGGAWFGGFTGELFHWSDGRVRQFELVDRTTPESIPGIIKLLPVSPDSLLVMCNGSIYSIEEGRPVFWRNWSINSLGFPIATTGRGRIVALGSHGLQSIDRDGDHALMDPSTTARYDGGGRAPFIDDAGNVWFCSAAGGMLRVRNVFDGVPGTDHWFSGMNVNTIAQDREGNKWLCTDGNGVLRITPAQLDLRNHVISGDQRDRAIHSVCVTRDQGVLFGSTHGKILHVDEHGMNLFAAPGDRGSARDRVRMIEQATDGRIWIAMDDWFGWAEGPPKSVRTHPVASIELRAGTNQAAVIGVKSLAIGTNDQVVATMFGVAEVIDTLGAAFARYNSALYAQFDRIYAPCIDSTGTLWFETENRLHSLSAGHPAEYPRLDSLFGIRITSIAQFGRHVLAIGSAGGGLALVRHGALLKRFTVEDGLASDQVRRVRVRHGRILVATDAGANVITDPLGEAGIMTWNLATGIPSEDVQDIDSDARTLWMATANGLCSSPIERDELVAQPPMLRFTSFAIGDSVLDPSDGLRIPLGTRVHVRAHAFCFRMPEDVRYAFRDAADTSWTASPDGTFILADTDAGTHTLLVRARAPDSPWSEPLELHYEVVLPWHMSGWFRGAIVFGLLLFGMILVRYVTRRRLRAHVLRLERENAQQEERRRIAADMHDDLGADISHLLLLARESRGSPSLSVQDQGNIAAIERHADRMVKKIDEVIWSLDPTDDKLLATLHFLQRYCEEFAEAHHLAFRTTAVTGEEQPYPSALRRELFLLVKELLINIAKHTDVRALRFEATVHTTYFTIAIEDDGHPLTNGNKPRNGHGMANMRQRLERLQGDVTTQPLEPRGTRTLVRARSTEFHHL